MHIYAPFSHYFPLIYIGLLCNRHSVSWERALTNTAGEKYTNKLGERERGETKRGGELVYHHFPSF